MRCRFPSSHTQQPYFLPPRPTRLFRTPPISSLLAHSYSMSWVPCLHSLHRALCSWGHPRRRNLPRLNKNFLMTLTNPGSFHRPTTKGLRSTRGTIHLRFTPREWQWISYEGSEAGPFDWWPFTGLLWRTFDHHCWSRLLLCFIFLIRGQHTAFPSLDTNDCGHRHHNCDAVIHANPPSSWDNITRDNKTGVCRSVIV